MAPATLNPTVAANARQKEKECRELLSRFPDHVEALHTLGRLCAQDGRTDEARACLDQALALSPQSADLQLTAARIAAQSDALERAEAGFKRAIALRPNFAPAQAGLGVIAQKRQQWSTAERHFRDAAKTTPDDVDVLLGLGQVRLARGDNEQAARLFMRATQLYPQHPGALTHYALALLNHGSAQAAARPLMRALELAPDYLPAQAVLGRVELMRGRPHEAEAAFRRVLARAPQDFDALAGLGHALRAMGQPGPAVAAYDAALAVQPDAEPLITSRAVCMLQHGYADQAVHDLRQWIAVHPRSSAPRTLLADVFDRSGHANQAVALWEQAAAADPSDAVAHAELARRREFGGDFAAAHVATQACAGDDRASTLLLRARDALRADDAIRAQRELLAIDVADLAPELALERFRLLGVVHDCNGHYAEAVLAFREAQRIRARRLPQMVDAAVFEPRLRALRSAQVLDEAPAQTPVLLLGLPGTGVEDVVALLADQPGVCVRLDRFHEQFDLFGDATDPRLLELLSLHEVRGLARRYARSAARSVPDDARVVVDWLPVLDARALAQARRALPGLRAIRIASADPQRAFLRWLAFGWNGLHAIDPLAAAHWWRRAREHLDLADEVIPVERVAGEALLADPLATGEAIAGWLGVQALVPGEQAAQAAQRRRTLAMQFRLSEPAAYDEVLGEALAAL